jgi:hypothetical protein
MRIYTIEMMRDGVAGGWRRRWPVWAALGAAFWSLAYGALGILWSTGGPGFPFGSMLAGARAATVGPQIVTLGGVGAAVALVMALRQPRGWAATLIIGFAWMMAFLLTLMIPDYRLLAAMGYAPVLLVGALFGWTPFSYTEAFPWPVLNQGICLLGGLLWGGTALGEQRLLRGACVACGRTDSPAWWTTRAAAARWGPWAVVVAVAIPLLYSATRWAWALGIPLGITLSFLQELQSSGLWLAGAGLATIAAVGALLTLGLVRPWGEVFPRWLPALGGRRVPPALAIAPATLVAVSVTAAGLMFIRLVLRDGFPPEGWATLAPELLWPLWGAALGAAAVAYAYRRRGRCTLCGRGHDTSTQTRALGP